MQNSCRLNYMITFTFYQIFPITSVNSINQLPKSISHYLSWFTKLTFINAGRGAVIQIASQMERF